MTPAAVAAAAGEVRAYLRMTAGEEALVERLVRSAFALGEAFTGAAFVVRAHEEVVAGGGAWVPLTAEPVRAVTGATALPDEEGPTGAAPFVLNPGEWEAEIGADGCGWVRVLRPGPARAAVRFEAGLAGSWEELPAPLAQGLVLLAAHLFEDRAGAKVPPAAVAALWRPWRRLRLERRRA